MRRLLGYQLYTTLVFLVNIVHHYYYICVVTVTYCCIYGSDVQEGRLSGTVNTVHRYGRLEQGLLEQDTALLRHLVGGGHNPLPDDGGIGLSVHGSH